jgi:hypothetical protein
MSAACAISTQSFGQASQINQIHMAFSVKHQNDNAHKTSLAYLTILILQCNQNRSLLEMMYSVNRVDKHIMK